MIHPRTERETETDADTNIDTDTSTIDQSQSLDLSCFPLLRTDQLHLHTEDTLMQSRDQLCPMVNSEEDVDIRDYSSKLLTLIHLELSERTRNQNLNEQRPSEEERERSVTIDVLHGDDVDGADYSELNENDIVMPHAPPSPSQKWSSKATSRGLPSPSYDAPPYVPSYAPQYGPSPSKKNIVSSTTTATTNNNNRNNSFRARAKARSTQIKRNKHKNTTQYKQALQLKQTQIRKHQAQERMDQRKRRREKALAIAMEREARAQARLERKRVKQVMKMEKKREVEAKKREVRFEMERVVKDAMLVPVSVMEEKGIKKHDQDGCTSKDLPDTNADQKKEQELELELEQGQEKVQEQEQLHIYAATAAAHVMENAGLNMLDDSDSGSSLTSEVESIMDDTDLDVDVTLDTIICNNTSTVDVDEDSDFEIDTNTEADEISGISAIFTDNVNANAIADACELVEVPLITTQKIKKCAQTDVLNSSHQIDPTQNRSAPPHKDHIWDVNNPIEFDGTKCGNSPQRDEKSSTVEQIEWLPWSPLKSVTIETTSTHRIGKETDEYSFTRVFPTFHSIFTAFAAIKGHINICDENMNIERECLEYQVKVLTKLLEMSKNECQNTDTSRSDMQLFSTKSIRPEVTTIISDVLLNQDDGTAWKDASSEHYAGNCWNLLWTWKKPKLNPEHLLVWQRISRFPDTSCLTRKDYLKKHLESKMVKSSQSVWNIMPLTYVLPKEFTSFLSAFSSIRKTCEMHGSNSNVWIMKPIGMSRGRGITVINDIGKVTYSSPTVIQKYLTNPLLFKGYKFDLRLYILVTSFSPLEAFIYKEGFARFGSRPYSSSADSLDDLQIHLTNSSIQKNYEGDFKSTHPARTAGSNGGGNKVKMSWLFEQLKSQNLLGDIAVIWKKIKELCLRTLVTVGDKIPNQPNAFEVFGFDVMIDENKKPWLIEVNSCPALSRENELDATLKERMIEDTIKIVSPPNYNKQALVHICKRRLHQKKISLAKDISEREILDQDLRLILNNSLPRQYGEDPNLPTGYERLAPGILFDQLGGRA